MWNNEGCREVNHSVPTEANRKLLVPLPGLEKVQRELFHLEIMLTSNGKVVSW